MYVFMEIAPALFVLPVVWLVHRPPVRLRTLLFSAVVVVALWYPYLRFEAGRHFIDIRSQVQRKYILPSNYKDAWCNSNATLEIWTGETYQPFVNFESKPGETVEDKSVLKAWSRLLVPAKGVAGLLLANFQRVAQIPGISPILALMVLGTMVLLSLSESSLNAIRRFCRSRSNLIGGGLILCAVLGNEFFLASCLAPDRTLADSTLLPIRTLQIVLLTGGMALLMRRYTAARWLFDRATSYARSVKSGSKPGLLVISLLIPWLILLLLVDPKLGPQTILVMAASSYFSWRVGHLHTGKTENCSTVDLGEPDSSELDSIRESTPGGPIRFMDRVRLLRIGLRSSPGRGLHRRSNSFSGQSQGGDWLPDCNLRVHARLPHPGSTVQGWRRIRFLFQAASRDSEHGPLC